MPSKTPAPAETPPKRWSVRLGRVAHLHGEMLSPMHREIEVDDVSLAELGDAVASKTEIPPPQGQG